MSRQQRKLILLAAALPLAAQAGTIATPSAPITTTVAREVQRDVSPPLRDLIPQVQDPNSLNPTEYVVPNVILDVDDLYIDLAQPRAPQNVQRSPSGSPTPAVGVAVNGMRIGLGGGGVPPDTTGDVGPNHFFQWVNTSWALFDKNTGALVDIPNDADDVVPGNSFFAGFGGLCQTTNRGDPLVLWDGHARRWLVSQFAFTSTSAPPFLQCVAVSTSEDPLGSYNRYAFQYPSFNDYGKMGVWVTEDGGQNAYVFSQHEFGAAFEGASFAVVERDRMLAGQSAQFIRVAGLDAFGVLPFHLEGDEAMPAGACPMFVHFQSSGSGYRIWDYCVDWAAGSVNFNPIPTIVESDPYLVGLNGIGQLDSTTRLDDFGGNTMYLAAMRAFGPTGPQEAYGVITHAVNVGNFQAGARWVQFGFTTPPSDPGEDLFASGFEDGESNAFEAVATQKRLVDSGTYAPDADSRWMGGINIDRNGNIALGYNVASEALNPQVRIAGRLRTDPAGTLRDESQCSPTNTGAQTGLFSGRARWGDYATMGVDPDDECTFWFTNEYYTSTSNSTWNTRICSVTLPGCGDNDFVLEVTPATGVSVCAADGDAEVSVRAGEFGSIGANIALSAGALPGGMSLNFGSTSIAAGQSTTVDLVGSAALSDGTYDVQINGMAAALNRSVNFPLSVSSATSAAPTLEIPANGSAGVVPRPTYFWGNPDNAVEFFIEVATDAGFSNIVDSALVESSLAYTSSILLQSDTQYFWRVTPSNFCGQGATSATFSFTTGVPGTCAPGTTPVSVFADNFNGGANGWTTNSPVGPSSWQQITAPAGTNLTTMVWRATNPPNPASDNSSDQRLVSPTINVPSVNTGVGESVFLRYDAFHNFEQDGPNGCWDAGQLEASTDGGSSFTQLLDNVLYTDPYTGLITVNAQNPNSGTPGWCAAVGNTSVQSIVDLTGFSGGPVRLRYRVVTDGNTAGNGDAVPVGFFIDNLEVIHCVD